jgi:hypothetical protein
MQKSFSTPKIHAQYCTKFLPDHGPGQFQHLTAGFDVGFLQVQQVHVESHTVVAENQ